MPCRNEEGYIEDCVRSVLAQDYPTDRLEILVADGMSTDATREILARYAASGKLRVIDNPDHIQAAGLNAAIREARGDVIIRMDVHADYAPDFVRRCVEVLEETGADNVGGAARARAKTFFQRALCAALGSPLGVGGSKYRDPDAEGWVDTVFPGAFRRRVFETVGMFDPRAITNEDAEINQRIHDAGGRVWLSKKIHVWYFPRDSFRSLARQYFRYGKGRARTLHKHKKFLVLRPAIPFLFVATGALLLATTPWQPLPLTALAFGGYAAMTLAEALRVVWKNGTGLAAVPVVWAIFPVLHLAHGTGFAAGLAQYALSPDWPREPERTHTRSPRSTASRTAAPQPSASPNPNPT